MTLRVNAMAFIAACNIRYGDVIHEHILEC